jgi:hypothetical protein
LLVSPHDLVTAESEASQPLTVVAISAIIEI